jgi:lipopolysaccharide transport system ATP-binding protein
MNKTIESLNLGNVAISVENISKAYRLGQIGTGTFTHDLQVWWAKLRGKPNPLLRLGEADHGNRNGEIVWALKDVSFAVPQGEVLGIIGRNGAGKSTLLKVLSRVTAPTSGRIRTKGRVASLLEVGTGFHPELTGRENIYLNGSILGMSRLEINRKFDEIVDFSGVEKFIDTPVKRYSSGMYVRLAFAVAAHLEPEILVVDEVLAVGDAEFQKKCLGKMGDVAKEGRTVLFVSHNMGAITNLCEKCILIHKGVLDVSGPSALVIEHYLGLMESSEIKGTIDAQLFTDRSGIGGGRITGIEFKDRQCISKATFGIGEPFSIIIKVRLDREITQIVAGIEVRSVEGLQVLNLRSDSSGISFGPYAPGQEIRLEVDVPGMPLYPGVYFIEPWFAEKSGRRIDQIHSKIQISLEAKGLYRSEALIQKGKGVFILDCDWSERAR